LHDFWHELLTFQNIDVYGEDHGRDDDCCEGARGDVGKVGGEEGAGHEDDEAGHDSAKCGSRAAGPIDGAAAEARNDRH
jgi:hypothetical protein